LIDKKVPSISSRRINRSPHILGDKGKANAMATLEAFLQQSATFVKQTLPGLPAYR
jgi:hypothetical protein